MIKSASYYQNLTGHPYHKNLDINMNTNKDILIFDTLFSNVKVFRMQQFYDERGYFCETYSKSKWLKYLNINSEFLQDNESLSPG